MEKTISVDPEKERVLKDSRPVIHIPSNGLTRGVSQTRDGLGFRSRSGLATPQIVQNEEGRENESPIPDQYGLGWPGSCFPRQKVK